MNNINTSIKLLTAQFMIAILHVHFQDQLEHYKRQKQRTAFIQQMQLMTNAFYFKKFGTKKRMKKRWWVKKRSFDLWGRIVSNQFTKEDWLANFRISSSTFKYICRRLRPYLSAQKRWVRKPLGVQKKVAIALFKLGSSVEYRIVADKFGTNKCVVHKCLYDFCNAVIAEFGKDFLVMPDELEAEEISASFEKICGVSNIIGAMGNTHIPIMAPPDGSGAFINPQGWASYNVLAVVDNTHMFRYANCQHPGSTNDTEATVLNDINNLIPKNVKNINEEDIPYIILGDPSHPPLPWLLKGYKENLTNEEACIDRGKLVVEIAFERLKARFRCLLKRLDIRYKFVPKVVLTCVILHNVVERRNDVFVQKWLEEVCEAEALLPQPNSFEIREFDENSVWRLGDEVPVQGLSS